MIVYNYLRLRWWMPKYYWIASVMGYDTLRDREAAEVLAELLSSIDPPLTELLRITCGRDAIVFGAGPSLDKVISELINLGSMEAIRRCCSLFAADGATQALLEHGIVPDVVITDLDGDVSSIFESGLEGSIVVVHGHGDNIGRLFKYVEELKKVTRKLVGTVQVEPKYPVMNFGGFTDGDRAVFMAEYFGARRVIMVGMDFGKVVGRRSKPWLKSDVRAWRDKLMKLKIAKELISWLAKERSVEVLTTSKEAPQGIKRVSPRELSDLVGGSCCG